MIIYLFKLRSSLKNNNNLAKFLKKFCATTARHTSAERKLNNLCY